MLVIESLLFHGYEVFLRVEGVEGRRECVSERKEGREREGRRGGDGDVNRVVRQGSFRRLVKNFCFTEEKREQQRKPSVFLSVFLQSPTQPSVSPPW